MKFEENVDEFEKIKTADYIADYANGCRCMFLQETDLCEVCKEVAKNSSGEENESP